MKKIKIKELGKIISGGTPSTANENFWDGELIWITPKDLSKNKSKYIFIRQAGYAALQGRARLHQQHT